MANPSAPEPIRKSDWVLTQKAFQQLLDWFDGGTDSGGERYLEIRRRLVLYFNRKNCPSPEDLADETLNRVTRRLEEEGAIKGDAPAQYCYIVARFVLLEFLRRQNRQQPMDGDMPAATESDERNDAERRAESLERCLQHLSADDRKMIVSYYHGEQRLKIQNRKKMSAHLGVSLNALSIRACRIRSKLEACVRKQLRSE